MKDSSTRLNFQREATRELAGRIRNRGTMLCLSKGDLSMAGTHDKENEGFKQGSQGSQQGGQGSQRIQGGQSTQGGQGTTHGTQGSQRMEGGSSTQGSQGTQGTQQMKDPVCGMKLEHGKSSHTSSYQGQNYNFCSQECKQKFDRSPQQYAQRTA